MTEGKLSHLEDRFSHLRTDSVIERADLVI